MPKKALDVSCVFCSRTFCNPQIYYKHANKEHHQDVLDSWYPCELCLFYLPTEEVLKKHKSCVHSVKEAPTRIQCTFCDKTHCNTHEFYKHANRLHKEQILNSWFACLDCNIFFPDEDVLKNHTFQAHSNSSNELTERVTCPHCPKHFSRTVEFYKHMNNSHLEEILMAWLQCDLCEMFFPRVDVLDRHRSRVHSVRKVSQRAIHCFCCMQAFIRLEDYYHHANQEHSEMLSESWTQCRLCDFYFPDELEVERHIAEDHDDKAANSDIQLQLQNIDNDNGVGVECLNCFKKFSNTKILSAHIRKVHSSLSLLARKRKPKFENSQVLQDVDEDGAPTASSSSIVDQPKKPDLKDMSSFKCPCCPLVFPVLAILSIHMAMMHPMPSTSSSMFAPPFNHQIKEESNGEMQWFTCPHCSRLFHSRLILNAHMSFMHPELPLAPPTPSATQTNGISEIQSNGNHGQTNGNVTCPFCFHSLEDFESYINHANDLHAEAAVSAGWLHCGECDLRLPTVHDLNDHRSKEHESISDPLSLPLDDRSKTQAPNADMKQVQEEPERIEIKVELFDPEESPIRS